MRGISSEHFSALRTTQSYLANQNCLDDRPVRRQYLKAGIVVIIALLLVPCFLQAQVNTQGQWTTLSATMPVNPAHQVVMKNGKVLIVAGNGAGASGTPQAAIYDPSTQTVSTPQTVGWDMFCNEMVVLVDGRPLIVGGFGYTKNSIYDPSAGTFTDQQQTKYAHWYPSVMATSTGSVLALGGIDANGNTSLPVELFDGSTWTTAFGPAVWTPALYPRGHVLGNGKIFYSGWQTTSTIVDENTGQENQNVATTNYSSQRVYGTSVLLPLYPPNYPAKVLILGGNTPSTATSEISSDLTQNQTNPTWSWGPNMAHARIQAVATILPDGTVLVTGGSTNDEDANTAALGAELYNPSNNAFTSLASETYVRLYHSTAILLPDATVMVAGSQPGLGASPPSSAYETHIEIFKPPYLFNSSGGLATRPTITSVPANISYGEGFQIQTPDAANISKVVLMRPGSVTHAFNVEQRLVGMSFTAGSGVLNVTAPSDYVSTSTGRTNPAPPGYYMVFLVNSSGVPSTAAWVQLKPALTISPVTQVTGGSANYTVTVSDSNAFGGGCVSFAASGVSGATASFNPTSVCGTGSTTLTMNAAATNAGAYTLAVTGTGGGQTHITRSALVRDFSLSVSPTSQSFPSGGGSNNYTVTVSPVNNFPGGVTLTLTNLPASTTYSCSPNPVTGSSTNSTCTVTTNGSTPVGSFTFNINGTSGSITHTISATLVQHGTIILRPTTISLGCLCNDFINSANAADGNLSTFASGPSNGTTAYTEDLYSGFTAPAGTPTSITLKVSSSYSTGSNFADMVLLSYSTDNGSNWNSIYAVFAGGGSRGQQTDTVSLPLNVNFANIRVEPTVNNGGTASQQVYEIWIEVTE